MAPPTMVTVARVETAIDETGRHARLVGWTAVVFAMTFILALVLVDSAPHLDASSASFTAFYAGDNTALVTAGFYLVPFAGIAFLWNMAALRQLIGAATMSAKPMPAALQLLGGIVFVALLFAGMAAAGAVALFKQLGITALPSTDVTRSLLAVGYAMVFIYASRGAGMFVIASTTLLRRARMVPGWVAAASYLVAAVMLVSVSLNPITLLLPPCWAVAVGATVVIGVNRSARTPSQ